MGTISSGSGFFSGLDTRSIIDQLIAVESRPRRQFQNRLAQIQLQSAAYLDINSRLNALRTASAAFRTSNPFNTRAATTSNPEALTATAAAGATPGTYSVLVDRLVSTQQLASRGFSDRSGAAAGLSSLTVESAVARLDRDVALGDLNAGSGVTRGRLTVTDASGARAEIDLSRAATVNEVLETINASTGVRVRAGVQDGRLVISNLATGSGPLRVENVGDTNTASSLGIAGTSGDGRLVGAPVYTLNRNTTLASLNDGRGVWIRADASPTPSNFSISVTDPMGGITSVPVYLGETPDPADPTRVTQRAAVTVGEVVDRINLALEMADVVDVSAQIDAEQGRIRLVDVRSPEVTWDDRSFVITDPGSGTTARDLGLLTPTARRTSVDGGRVLAGLNTTLASGLNGGAGLAGDGRLNITSRDGVAMVIDLSGADTLERIARRISEGSAGRLSLGLDAQGTGLTLTDTTGGAASNLIVTGTAGADTAASLGLSTGPAGVAATSVSSGNLQRQYLSSATPVASLNNGRGIGTGRFRLTDSTGAVAIVDIASDTRTIGDVLDEINTRGLALTARINATGDGIELIENRPAGPGSVRIRVEDVSGAVAAGLNLAGTAADTGADNRLDGSFERVIAIDANDSLEQVVAKVNRANAGVSASIIRDGIGGTPFRLVLSSTASGASGRFVVRSAGQDPAFATLEAGRDARVFIGSTDPARAVLAGGSSNAIDGVIQGVTLNLKSIPTGPVSVTVAEDSAAAETAVDALVRAFNTVIERIDFQTRVDPAAQRASPLSGDGTVRELRQSLARTAQASNLNAAARFDSLADVGVRVGQGGRLEFNRDRFRAALAEDPAAVQALFTTREIRENTGTEVAPGVRVRDPNAAQEFSRLGVVGQLEALADRYVSVAGGVLTARTNGLEQQRRTQNQRLAEFDARIERRRATLERQFQAMERSIGQLQNQQNALASIRR